MVIMSFSPISWLKDFFQIKKTRLDIKKSKEELELLKNEKNKLHSRIVKPSADDVKKYDPNTKKLLIKLSEEIDLFKSEINMSDRREYRTEYKIDIFVIHERWKGQYKLFDALLNSYKNKIELFLFNSFFFSRLNDNSDTQYSYYKKEFISNFVDPINDDINLFKEKYLWNDSTTNNDLLISEWKLNRELPKGKILPELYSIYTFDNILAFGILDQKLSKLFDEKTRDMNTDDQIIQDLNTLISKRAFYNSINLMDSYNIRKSIVVIDSSWSEFFIKECDVLRIAYKIDDFTD